MKQTNLLSDICRLAIHHSTHPPQRYEKAPMHNLLHVVNSQMTRKVQLVDSKQPPKSSHSFCWLCTSYNGTTKYAENPHNSTWCDWFRNHANVMKGLSDCVEVRRATLFIIPQYNDTLLFWKMTFLVGCEDSTNENMKRVV